MGAFFNLAGTLATGGFALVGLSLVLLTVLALAAASHPFFALMLLLFITSTLKS